MTTSVCNDIIEQIGANWHTEDELTQLIGAELDKLLRFFLGGGEAVLMTCLVGAELDRLLRLSGNGQL